MEGSEKVLVAYASKYGATADIADAIVDTLQQEGLAAEARPAKEVSDLRNYDAVVLGAPVFAGRWMSEATDFLKRHRASLKNMPVAYFTVGVLPYEQPETGRQVHDRVIKKARKLAPEVDPVAVGVFNGALNKAKLGRFIRFVMTIMRAKDGDYRDWEAIRSWGQSLVTKIPVAR